VTPNGQRSFYNNFDPFNPAAPLRDMREYLLAIKKKELMASPGKSQPALCARFIAFRR
jgi:hypothetical protein